MKRPLVHDYQFNMKLPRRLHKRMLARAEAEGLSASEYVRKLLILSLAVKRRTK
jgi:predicted HicB family RNase H-like nuclease